MKHFQETQKLNLAMMIQGMVEENYNMFHNLFVWYDNFDILISFEFDHKTTSQNFGNDCLL